MIDKIPPQALELEQAVLGALLLEREAIANVDITKEIFYKQSHQIIFEAIENLDRQGKQVDLLTVTQALQSKFDEELNPVYITKLTNKVASAAHIEQHIIALKEMFVRRELIRTAQENLKLAYDTSNDLDDIISTYEKSIDNVDKVLIGKNTGRELKPILDDLSKEIEQRVVRANEGGFNGVNTGFGTLNQFTAGWQDDWLVVFAARPAMGKTAIAINKFAKDAAITGKHVNIFSLEMSDTSLAERLVLGASGIDSYDFKNGRMTDQNWHDYNRAVAELQELPIFIDDTPYVSISHIRNVTRANKRKGKCDLVIIDYLQLAKAQSKQGKNREQEVSEMSRRLKALAKELKVPVILLSQLSRKVEDRADKRPQLSDLRESGAIEQDADVVIFPLRPSYYDKSEEQNKGLLIVAKNRHGEIGDIEFYHNESMTNFSDVPFNSYLYNEPF